MNKLLNYAALTNKVKAAEALYGAYKYQQVNKKEQTPLMIAASNNNLELVKLFKDLAPLKDCNNDTALDYALNCGADAEVAEFLEQLCE